MKRTGLIIGVSMMVLHGWAQTTAPSWTQFEQDRSEGRASTLPDYSYAGYHFSEKALPDISGWTQFDVTSYGAIADDAGFDDAAIQSAIDAAEAHSGPAIVFFPPGKFIVSEDNSTANFIHIKRDSIVLKGSGSGTGGTEIFMKEKRVLNGHWQFKIGSEPTETGLTKLIAPVNRGDFSVFVQDPSMLSVGDVIRISHKSEEFARAHFGDLALLAEWTRLFGSGGGMSVYELHEISAISGNRVTFKNPVQADFPTLPQSFSILSHTTIQEVGVEDILFSSDWENYGEPFFHHKDNIHDYGWNALEFVQVRNGWMRNCAFRSWSQGVNVKQSIGVTIENTTMLGEKGHASFLTRRSFGLLVKDCSDEPGQHHGPGTSFQGVNTVYLRHTMQSGQSVDAHAGQPYATLIDNVLGGDFDQNGGNVAAYPHHAQHLTFWNFRHRSVDNENYNFWSGTSNQNTYANPLFVGFRADSEVTLTNTGLNELFGQEAAPLSLFEAQLNLRLTDAATQPQVAFISPEYNGEIAKGNALEVHADAQDPDGSITKVALYVDDVLIREDLTAPYAWGTDVATDPALFGLSPGRYRLKIAATDNVGNITTDEIVVTIGSFPTVSFSSPSLGDVVEVGTLVEVSASASDSDGSIASVSLYVDDVLARTITTAPYTWGLDASTDPALATLSSGYRELKFEATDDDGLVALDSISIYANVYPTVSFETPLDGDSFEPEANLVLVVNATDEDDYIERVEMTMNNTRLRDELGAPFEWGQRSDADPQLFGLEIGEYTFEAVAYDSLDNFNLSTITISVEEIPLGFNAPIDEALNVYPNPFHNQFYLDVAFEEIVSLKLFDINGKDISTQMNVSKQNDNKVVIGLSNEAVSSMLFLALKTVDNHHKLIKILKE